MTTTNEPTPAAPKTGADTDFSQEFAKYVETAPNPPPSADGQKPEKAATAQPAETAEDGQPPDGGAVEPAGGDGAEVEKTKTPRKGGFQQRIDRLTATSAEQQRTIARLEGLLAAEQGKAPDPTKYELGKFDPDYISADARYQMRIETMRGAADEAQAASISAVESAVEDVINAGLESDPAFQSEVVTPLMEGKVVVPRVVEMAILEAEHGHKILAALVRDPDTLAKVSKMTPSGQAVWVGKQDVKFSVPEPAKKPIGKPITPVPVATTVLNGSPPPDTTPADMPLADFFSLARDIEKRARGQ